MIHCLDSKAMEIEAMDMFSLVVLVKAEYESDSLLALSITIKQRK